MIVTRDRFPPYRVDLTELFGRWLARTLDIDWVMRGGHRGQSTAGGGTGGRFLVSRRGALPWMWLQLRQGLRAAFGPVDLVQVRDAALSAAMFLAMAKIGRRPFVYWMSFPMAEGYLQRGRRPAPDDPVWLRLARLGYGALAKTLLYRWVLPRADHVFVQSERMKADVAAMGIAPERITAVPIGVSIETYSPQTIAPSQDDRLLGLQVLIYVGALDPERNIEQLVQALARVTQATLDPMLVIVGDATAGERGGLERIALQAGVADRLMFTGHLPLAEALGYVRRADVCLAPFPVWPEIYRSATPTKLVEYLAMGRPVVACAHPDQSQVIAESGAGLIAIPTAEGFAAAIITLLNDPSGAEAMGALGPPWVAAHRDYAAISQSVLCVYDALLRDTGR